MNRIIIPSLKANDYDGAVAAGIDAIADEIS